jgi:N-methylhydantoinase A
MGLLLAEVSFDFARTMIVKDGDDTSERVRLLFKNFERDGHELLERSGMSGRHVFDYAVDARFSGQGHELTATVNDDPEGDTLLSTAGTAFRKLYADTYGITRNDDPIEFVTWRLRARLERSLGRSATYVPSRLNTRSATPTERTAYFPEIGGWVPCAVIDRDSLAIGTTVNGPALVCEDEATTMILPGDLAVVDDQYNLDVRLTSNGEPG